MRYAANQTPEPNLLGYLVLAGFAAAGLWAITRPRTAQASPRCPAITPERLAAYNQQADVSVAYFPAATSPPTGEVTAEGRIFFPESADQRSLAQPVIVIIAGDQFWRYEGSPGQPVVAVLSPQDKAIYCSMA